jgi:hypothetical protein
MQMHYWLQVKAFARFDQVKALLEFMNISQLCLVSESSDYPMKGQKSHWIGLMRSSNMVVIIVTVYLILHVLMSSNMVALIVTVSDVL